MKVQALFIAIVSLCLFAACQPAGNEEQKPLVTETFKIERVFMHEPGNYTFFYADRQEPKKLLSFRVRYAKKLDIFQDVSPAEKGWVTIVSRGECGFYCFDAESVEIHLHSAQEINGAGWDHGKFGSGQTVVVE